MFLRAIIIICIIESVAFNNVKYRISQQLLQKTNITVLHFQIETISEAQAQRCMLISAIPELQSKMIKVNKVKE